MTADLQSLTGVDFEHLIASAMLHDAAFARAFGRHIEPLYFQSTEAKWLATQFRSYWLEYHVAPSADAIAADLLLATDLDDDRRNAIRFVYNKLAAIARNPAERAQMRSLEKHTRAWMQQRYIEQALQQSVSELESGRLNLERLAARFRTPLSIGLVEEESAHFLIADFDRFLAEMRKERGVPRIGTYVPAFDAQISGGIKAGELAAILAAPGRGKSQLLCHIGRSSVARGLKVIHISLEMDALSVWQRYMGGLVNMNTVEIRRLGAEGNLNIRPKLDACGVEGEVDIVRFPGGTHLSRLVEYIDGRANAEQFVPDLVVIDYGDEVGLPDSSLKTYEKHEAVFEGMRSQIAIPFKLPVWTAMQANRSGASKRELTEADIADAFAKQQPLDLLIGLETIKSDKLSDDRQLVTFNTLKVRSEAQPPSFDCYMNPQTATFAAADRNERTVSGWGEQGADA